MRPIICKNEKFLPASPTWRRRGFTLVEIMIVLGILSILGGYTFLSVRGSIERARVERGASRLGFQLQQAKSAALSNNQTAEVALNQDTNVYTVWIDADRDGNKADGEVDTVVLVNPGQVSVRSTWISGLFNSYGQFLTSGDQRTITSQKTVFSSGERVQTVIIRGSGSIHREGS